MNSKAPIKDKPSNVTARLAKIAKDIRQFEKQTIASIIKIGGLLQEAADTCDHGQYAEWLIREFGWSDQTALHYRNVYQFNKAIGAAYRQRNSTGQKPNGLAFESVAELNLTQSALYLVAGMKRDEQQTARVAVIKAATHERVNYRRAREIMLQVQDEEDGIDPQPPKGEKTKQVNPPSLDKAKFDCQLSGIAVTIKNADKLIAPHIDGLSEAWVNGTAEDILGLINGLKNLLDRIRKNQPNPRGHLHIVSDPAQPGPAATDDDLDELDRLRAENAFLKAKLAAKSHRVLEQAVMQFDYLIKDAASLEARKSMDMILESARKQEKERDDTVAYARKVTRHPFDV